MTGRFVEAVSFDPGGSLNRIASAEGTLALERNNI